MVGKCVACSVYGAPGSGTRIYCWLFGAHSFWWDALLNLDAGGSGLVLPQLDMPDFVDSSWEAILRSEWGMGGGRVVQKEGREGEL